MNVSIGTNGNDNLYSTAGFFAIGLSGDDTLSTQQSNILDQGLFGGTGNDIYNVKKGTSAIIADAGGYDTVNISAPYYSGTLSGYILDNNWFGINNAQYGIAIVFTDYSNPNHTIEKIHFSNKTFSFSEFLREASNAPHYSSSQDDNLIKYLSQMSDVYTEAINQLARGENIPFGFNEQYYDTSNQDIARAIDTGYILTGGLHYMDCGKYEGRSPNLAYNQDYYLSHNPDVANTVAQGITTGYDHFVNSGQFEGRQGSAEFNAYAYLAANLDVASAVQSGMIGTAFQHFAQSGQYEGRALAPGFTEGQYLAANSDVAATVQAGSMPSGYYHYAFNGCHEGRPVIPVETVGVYQAQDISA